MSNENRSHDENQDKLLLSPTIFSCQLTITHLNVALYPWGTDEHLDRYRRIIEDHWYNHQGNYNCRLNWLSGIDWDGGYHKIPEKHFDIFIYDTIFLNYYKSQGWLCPFEYGDIKYADELYPNLLSWIKEEDKYYGIPIYGCIYALFYRSNDLELGKMKNFDDLIGLASKREFIMRKPSETIKTLTYFELLDEKDKINEITDENLNLSVVHRLSEFYKHSKCFLGDADRFLFDEVAFYIGFTEDLNTMLIVNEKDFDELELMFVPSNNNDQSQCWLDCIGIHSQTKSRQTYEKSLELANLMSCSSVMNQYFQEETYLIPMNRLTVSRLAKEKLIYDKIERLIESVHFQPSSTLSSLLDGFVLTSDRWTKALTVLNGQHEKNIEST